MNLSGVGERTEAEVGEILRARREALGLTQEDVAGVSSSTVRIAENGRGLPQRGLTRAAFAQALGWPADAMDQLLAGAEPTSLAADTPAVDTLEVDASGVDLDELRRLNPEAYAQLMDFARTLIDQAKRDQ